MKKILVSLLLILLLISSNAWSAGVLDMTEDTSPTSDDITYVINDPGGVPADRKVTLGNAITKAHGLTGINTVIKLGATNVFESAGFIIIAPTTGGILLGTGTGTYTPLAIGSVEDILKSNGTTGVWTSSPSVATLTARSANSITLGTDSAGSGPAIGSMIFHNATNTNHFSLISGTTGAALSWTLPIAAPGGANYLLNVDADGTMGYTDPSTLGSFPALDDVTNPDAAKTFTLLDNNASALSFGATGKADILKIITTDAGEGVSMSGYHTVTGLGTFDTLSAGATGFSVDADGDTTVKSLTVTRVAGQVSKADFYEIPANGDNKVTLQPADSLGADYVVTLPSATGTVQLTTGFPASPPGIVERLGATFDGGGVAIAVNKVAYMHVPFAITTIDSWVVQCHEDSGTTGIIITPYLDAYAADTHPTTTMCTTGTAPHTTDGAGAGGKVHKANWDCNITAIPADSMIMFKVTTAPTDSTWCSVTLKVTR